MYYRRIEREGQAGGMPPSGVSIQSNVSRCLSPLSRFYALSRSALALCALSISHALSPVRDRVCRRSSVHTVRGDGRWRGKGNQKGGVLPLSWRRRRERGVFTRIALISVSLLYFSCSSYASLLRDVRDCRRALKSLGEREVFDLDPGSY